MIHSLFVINRSGDVFLEKHWKSVVGRSVCDYFFEARERAGEPENVPPVLQTPHHYLISIYRDNIFFLSVIQTEAPPLFVIEFLHRVAEMFQVSVCLCVCMCVFVFAQGTKYYAFVCVYMTRTLRAYCFPSVFN